MKILYSQIKEMVPELKATPKQVGEVLTMIGFMMDDFKEVEYLGKKDFLISLEIRQNRPDCLSVIGLAKEVAAYYGLTFKSPVFSKINFGNDKLAIKVNAEKQVKRIIAAKIENIKNYESPDWIKNFLSFYGINSKSFLVDLSNYVMIITGQPSHIFDADKVDGNLSWSLNDKFKSMKTFDESEIKIKKQSLIIEDEGNILALAGIIGGDRAKIELETKSIILEMSVYEGAIINKNSRDLNVATEASIRLGKKLDPNNLEFSMQFLISLILKYCGGQVQSALFDYYPQKYFSKNITFDPMLPGLFAGVDISPEEAQKILKNLGCKIKKRNKKLIVVPPTNRTDLEIKEDLVEEVVRIFGYYNIPSDKIPVLEVVPKITPKTVYLSEKIRDIMQASGFDEILSLPLVAKEINSETKYRDIEIISTQNSINEDFPELRQSLAVGLILQLKNYLKLGVEDIKIFEIGKIFEKINNNYTEKEYLGILVKSDQKNISGIKQNIEILLRSLGVRNIKYYSLKEGPGIANPYSVFNIVINKKIVGILYKLNIPKINNAYFAEINIEETSKIIEKKNNYSTFEITQKIVTLDANVELKKEESIYDYLENIEKKINKENIISLKILDFFPLNTKIRYTIRASYKNLSDQDAKKCHLLAFNLKNI